MGMIHSLWPAWVQWFLTVPGEAPDAYKDALIAVASVAAVVWTGGLITMQLKKTSVVLMNGLDYLQTAFMGSMLALFASGVWLRVIVLAFGVYYIQLAFQQLILARKLWLCHTDGEEIVTINPDGVPRSVACGPYAKALVQYVFWTLVSILGYVAIFVWPTRFAMSIFTWTILYVGMQMVLIRLYTAIDVSIDNKADAPKVIDSTFTGRRVDTSTTRARRERKNASWAWMRYFAIAIMTIVIFGVVGNLLRRFLGSKPTPDQSLTALGVDVAVITFALVAFQILIAFKQVDLQEIEIGLVEDQGLILERQEAEMRRAAKLVLWAESIPQGEWGENMVFSIGLNLRYGNIGDKTAESATILLLLPPAFGMIGAPGSSTVWRFRDTKVDRNGILYTIAELDLKTLIFPNSPYEIVWQRLVSNFFMNDAPFYYRMIYSDGATPDYAGWNELGTTAPNFGPASH
jgi:hypothetical protein